MSESASLPARLARTKETEVEKLEYSAVIQRVVDGIVRVCPQSTPWGDGDDGSWGWWADGNMSCDCNREIQFARAAGDNKPAIRCSDGRFRVLEFRFADGRVLAGPDANPQT